MCTERLRDMELFGLLDNDNFFKPLCSKNKEVYLDCIEILYEDEQFNGYLSENLSKRGIDDYLRWTKKSFADEDEFLCKKGSSEILRYFRYCGWITDFERTASGDYVSYLTKYCRSLIKHFQKEINKGRDTRISTHILNIYRLFKEMYQKDGFAKLEFVNSPYINVYISIMDDYDDLRTELIELEQNVNSYCSSLLKTDPKFEEIIGQYFDTEMRKFFNDYFSLKERGGLIAYTNRIGEYLRRMMSDETIMNNLYKQYGVAKLMDEDESHRQVDKMMDSIENFMTYKYAKKMKLIDDSLENYYQILTSKFNLINSSGFNILDATNKLLTKISSSENEEADKMLCLLFDKCCSVHTNALITSESFARKQIKRYEYTQVPISNSSISDEERKRRTDELYEKSFNEFSPDEVENHFNEKLIDSDLVEFKYEYEPSHKDALMYASCTAFSTSKRFPYAVTIEDPVINNDIYASNFIVTRKDDNNE